MCPEFLILISLSQKNTRMRVQVTVEIVSLRVVIHVIPVDSGGVTDLVAKIPQNHLS